MRRIQQISVRKLFGVFDHTIALKMEERITVIHGPNGFGKTILLKMIDALFNGYYYTFRTIPFEQFRVDFDNGSYIRVEQNATSGDDRELLEEKTPELNIYFSEEGVDETPFSPRGVSSSKLARNIERHVPGLFRIDSGRWIYQSTNEVLSLEGVIKRFGEMLPRYIKPEDEPIELKKMRQTIHVRFIETQRLFIRTDEIETQRPFIRSDEYEQPFSTWLSVDSYARELASNIQATLAEYANVSQSLDRTFPSRLISNPPPPLPDNELLEKLKDLEDKRLRLIDSGLLDQEQEVDLRPEQIAEADHAKSVLSVYVSDVERKLGVFDELSSKIDLFNELIDKKFQYKDIVISKRKGFTFIDANDKFLSPTKLSSGEQHELVLLYELLFKMRPNTLVLIDEPEISLHVEWKMDFLRDLEKIIDVAGFDVLIATHAPDLINNRRDLMVALKGPDV